MGIVGDNKQTLILKKTLIVWIKKASLVGACRGRY